MHPNPQNGYACATSSVSPAPDGFNTIALYLVVDGAGAAVALYEKALGAETVSATRSGEGRVLKARMRIGDSMLMLNDEFPDYGVFGPKKIGGSAVTIHLYVENVDAAWQKAIDAGFEFGMPLMDQPWGDRFGSLKDPFGHSWSLASRIEEVSPEELARRMG